MGKRDWDLFLQGHDEFYQSALAEIRAGRKESHWIWFIFPQIAGFGQSYMSKEYAIADLEEAAGYLEHPVLGGHLREICGALLALDSSDAEAVMGDIDSRKLRASMTLFHMAAPDEPVFMEVLEKFYGGQPDVLTLGILNR